MPAGRWWTRKLLTSALLRGAVLFPLVGLAMWASPSLAQEPDGLLPDLLAGGGRSRTGLWMLTVLLLLLSGFTSAAETAIFSLDRIDLLQLRTDARGFRRALGNLLAKPNDTLTTILILNNLVNVSLSLVGGAMAELYQTGMSPTLLAIVALCVTGLILVFGEVLPKCIAQFTAHWLAPYVAWPIYAIGIGMWPVRRIMNVLIGWVFSILRIPQAREADIVSEEELKVMLGAGRVSNLLEEEEREMIMGVFELDDTYAEQIMVPRSEVFSLPRDLDQAAMLIELRRSTHGRVPIYESSRDHLVGFVLAKEVLLNEHEDWGEYIRDILHVPERMRLDDLLRQFRRSSTQIAAVVDEYGQLAGIVTIRDLLEEIVGEMPERGEKFVPECKAMKDGSLRVQGKMKLAELARTLEIEFPEDIGSTAAGFMMNMLGEVPHEGSELQYAGHIFRVKRMAGRRVASLEVIGAAPEPAAAATGANGGRES